MLACGRQGDVVARVKVVHVHRNGTVDVVVLNRATIPERLRGKSRTVHIADLRYAGVSANSDKKFTCVSIASPPRGSASRLRLALLSSARRECRSASPLTNALPAPMVAPLSARSFWVQRIFFRGIECFREDGPTTLGPADNPFTAKNVVFETIVDPKSLKYSGRASTYEGRVDVGVPGEEELGHITIKARVR